MTDDLEARARALAVQILETAADEVRSALLRGLRKARGGCSALVWGGLLCGDATNGGTVLCSNCMGKPGPNTATIGDVGGGNG